MMGSTSWPQSRAIIALSPLSFASRKSAGARSATILGRCRFSTMSLSVLHPNGNAEGARIAGEPEHRSRIAGLGLQILEVVRVEYVLHPSEHFPTAREEKARAQIHDRVAVDLQIFRIGGVGVGRRAVIRIKTEIRHAV